MACAKPELVEGELSTKSAKSLFPPRSRPHPRNRKQIEDENEDEEDYDMKNVDSNLMNRFNHPQ